MDSWQGIFGINSSDAVEICSNNARYKEKHVGRKELSPALPVKFESEICFCISMLF